MLKEMIIAGAGGFLGTCGRYLMSRAAQLFFASPFPYGTFAANIVGCFIAGLIFGIAQRTNLVTPNVSLLLVTGFCGGFTTFSAFSNEVFQLAQGRLWGWSAGYLAASVLCGIAMVGLGRATVRLL